MRWVGVWLATVCVIVVVVAWFGLFPLRWNNSASLPTGLFLVEKIGTVRRGDLVSICPPLHVARWIRSRRYSGFGSCAGGVKPLGKTVVAVSGDVVRIEIDAVYVNGQRLAESRRIAADSRGWPMLLVPVGEMTVPAGYVWVHSSRTPRSLDSRYFGPLPVESVRGRLSAFWVM